MNDILNKHLELRLRVACLLVAWGSGNEREIQLAIDSLYSFMGGDFVEAAKDKKSG